MSQMVINDAHRIKMRALERAMLDTFEQVELEVKHHFAHGTYTRELLIPKGTLLTGKIHRHSCINILSKGKMKVITDEGDYEIEAPHVFVSGPQVKKAGYALEDSIWINVHPWEGERDLQKIEAAVISPSYDAIEGVEELCLGQQ